MRKAGRAVAGAQTIAEYAKICSAQFGYLLLISAANPRNSISLEAKNYEEN